MTRPRALRSSLQTPVARLSLEDHDGFVHVGFDDPIQRAEVAEALTDLSALGGVLVARGWAGPLAVVVECSRLIAAE